MPSLGNRHSGSCLPQVTSQVVMKMRLTFEGRKSRQRRADVSVLPPPLLIPCRQRRATQKEKKNPRELKQSLAPASLKFQSRTESPCFRRPPCALSSADKVGPLCSQSREPAAEDHGMESPQLPLVTTPSALSPIYLLAYQTHVAMSRYPSSQASSFPPQILGDFS